MRMPATDSSIMFVMSEIVGCGPALLMKRVMDDFNIREDGEEFII